jgi:Ohr subfamily peroxiredoxin
VSKRLYTATARVAGGRAGGTGSSSDAQLRVKLEAPRELGGDGTGTNPEQLFAVGYAACFSSALELVAQRRRRNIGNVAVDAEVSLVAFDNRTFGIEAALHVWAEEVTDLDEAVELLRAADDVCPYSNATRGNIKVDLSINGCRVSHGPPNDGTEASPA